MWDPNWLSQFPQAIFQPNEKIFHIGEQIQFNYYLLEGICAKMLSSDEGEELVLQYYQPGKMLGIHLHRYGDQNPLDFLAKTRCTCCKIPWELVDQQVRSDNALCYDLLQESVQECELLADATIAHVFGGGISVLGMALRSLAIPQPDGTYFLDPLFTNVELGKYCGIHTVSVSRLMTRLAHEGILERTKDGVIIYDLPRLSCYIKLDE